MPRTVQEIIDHADELAARFESGFDPNANKSEVTPLGELYDAVQARAATERLIAEKVQAARDSGTSWAAIGQLLGTSGEAARQRYGQAHRV
ncbi:MAG: hypothetical protein ABJA74_11260 [Lapillicoccus sp.]